MMRLARILATSTLALTVTGAPSRAEDAEALVPDLARKDSPASDCVDAAATAVQRRYESVLDLRADFVQRSTSVALGSSAGGQTTSSGNLVIAKPGKMRWSYEKPNPSLVVSNGSTLWIYDPTFREVQKLEVSEGYLSAAGVQFLLGAGDMRRDFEVTATTCDEGAVLLELVPREPASFERLRVLTNPATGDVAQTTIVDLFGNVTEVEFSNLRVNQEPDPGLFEFVPSEGVRVLELPGNAP
jgi:outer membrane lipoprotein carrier protein